MEADKQESEVAKLRAALKESTDILIMMKRELIAVNKGERWEIEPIIWLSEFAVDEAIKLLDNKPLPL